ncbi:MAG TPA: metallophosphoesterase family protein, partial [Bryobacteraceae bacterium]|nr:metallophosphoesterase family protein [Bryobacteraceae bacterium]
MSRVLLHVSDLHFGRIQPGLPEALREAAARIRPDVVVVSGDLTQRARTSEFQQARAFLEQLPSPRIVVPGNHDVPLHNLYGRFVERLGRFRSYITDDLEPAYVDSEVAVFGINTARSLTWKGGRINPGQIESLHARLCAVAPEVMRVVVTHHPFEVPPGFHHRELVRSARAAFEKWSSCGADLLLCGHLHVADSTTTESRYGAVGWHAIVV